MCSEVKSAFKYPSDVTVYWNGELVIYVSGKAPSQEYGAVVITSPGAYSKGKLLGVIELYNSTGKSQPEVVFAASEEYGTTNSIRAMALNTTSSNTGIQKRAAAILERDHIQPKLLQLACRHHMMKIIASDV